MIFLDWNAREFGRSNSFKMKHSILTSLAFATIIGSVSWGQGVDLKTSSIQWQGGNITGKMHFGEVPLKEGKLIVVRNEIQEGRFVVDLTRMTNTDLPEAYGDKLIGHLKSPDFFDVQSHPNAVLEIQSATPFQNGESYVNARVTIKGITQPVQFKAEKAGKSIRATLVLNRAKFDVRYGSGSFFDNLGDDLILDEITLEVELKTT